MACVKLYENFISKKAYLKKLIDHHVFTTIPLLILTLASWVLLTVFSSLHLYLTCLRATH